MSDNKNYRDAATGQYVTDEYAKEHPETTVSESEFQGAEIVETPAIPLTPGQFVDAPDENDQSDEG